MTHIYYIPTQGWYQEGENAEEYKDWQTANGHLHSLIDDMIYLLIYMNIYFRSKIGYNVICIWPQNSSPVECHINVSHDRRAEYVMCYRIVLRALDCVLIGLLSAPLWDYICTQINGNAKWIFGFLRILEASTSQHWNSIIRIMAERQGGRSWQPFVEGKIAHKNFCQARICYFRDRCVVLARNCKFAD